MERDFGETILDVLAPSEFLAEHSCLNELSYTTWSERTVQNKSSQITKSQKLLNFFVLRLNV